MLYNIPEIAITVGTITGLGVDIPKFERRLRHFAAQGLIEVNEFEGGGPRATQLFDREEACLAALLVVTAELFEFGVDLQRAIVRAVRHSTVSAKPLPGAQPAYDLARAIYGVADGEKWALVLTWRGRKDIQARFVPYSEAQPNEGTEELLSALGRPLFGRLILGVHDLFEPFARNVRA